MKIFKCLIRIESFPLSYRSVTGDYRGFYIDYWNIIKKKLESNKIIFKEDYTYSRDIEGLINKIYRKEYDILIGSFWVTHYRLNKVNFTYPIYFNSPKIVYNDSRDIQINMVSYIVKISQLWVKPLFYFLFFSLLIGFILTYYPKYKDDNLLVNLYYTFVSFLGQPLGFIFKIKNPKSYNMRIISLIFIFIFFLYIQTKIYSHSILIAKESDKINNSIINTKILSDSRISDEIISNLGGTPINIHKRGIFNDLISKKGDAQGMISGDQYIEKKINEGYNLIFSNINLGILFVAFPINKENTMLKKYIDDIIVNIRNNRDIEKLCREYFSQKKTIIC